LALGCYQRRTQTRSRHPVSAEPTRVTEKGATVYPGREQGTSVTGIQRVTTAFESLTQTTSSPMQQCARQPAREFKLF
jgi:hypothetical protein